MNLKITAVFLSLKPILHGLFNAGSTRGGGGGGGGMGTKCPRHFSMKQLNLLQLNLVHKLIRPMPINSVIN